MSYRIALVGNPNSGKTTLFNKLTGSSQRVGNWPGVTIDKKTGKIRGTDGAELVDTPGVYSLSPYSPEEIVARNYLLDEDPDVVINIVDATNLERNLFLTLQILDTGLKTVVALNMMDAVKKSGAEIDVGSLSSQLGCPVVPISALKGEGIEELTDTALALASKEHEPGYVKLSRDIEELIGCAEEKLRGSVPEKNLRWYAVKLLEKDDAVCERYPQILEELTGKITTVENDLDDDIDALISDARYNAIGDIVGKCAKRPDKGEIKETFSDKVDRIVTHRIWGIPIFIAVIGAIFFAIIGFSDPTGTVNITGIGTYLTDLLNDWIGGPLHDAIEQWCIDNNVSEIPKDLLLTAIVGGVGAVIGFLPQMLCLFLALCILEDIGYMARIAFVMDRVFRYFGLSGKSFIPVLVGTGCGVPGIMASRTIESERDRKITAMTVTMIPCGAKLPVIALIVAAFFPNNGFIALFAYVLGIVCILVSGIIMKKWKNLSGEPAPFIMELPPYHIPSIFNVIKGTLDRGWAFVKKAGTLILLSAILIWFLASFTPDMRYLGDSATSESILQIIGQSICFIFQPLGWGDNWQLTVGSITGLIAKENLIATLATVFSVEEGELEAILPTLMTSAAGLSFLVFNLLCAPCFAAIGAMHRELGTWKDTLKAVGYQCIFAYGVSAIIYAVAGAITGSTVVLSGWVAAAIAVIALAYLLIAKDPFLQNKKSEVHE